MARKSIVIPGFAHGQQPIPAASRVGNIVMTGGVHGIDPDTGKMAEGAENQARCTFVQLGRILAAAGASFDDVVKMTFFVASPEARAAINPEWIKAFPDADARPARHTINYDQLPAGAVLQCDCFAVITDK